jgi:hypothetical protein
VVILDELQHTHTGLCVILLCLLLPSFFVYHPTSDDYNQQTDHNFTHQPSLQLDYQPSRWQSAAEGYPIVIASVRHTRLMFVLYPERWWTPITLNHSDGQKGAEQIRFSLFSVYYYCSFVFQEIDAKTGCGFEGFPRLSLTQN